MRDLLGKLACYLMANGQRIRYLFAGVWNTLFGYVVGVLIYYSVGTHLNLVVIGVISNIVAITMAFLSYKVFVFRTKGNWIREYLRTYLVYGVTGFLSIGLLCLLVGGLRLPFWLAQGLAIAITAASSYVFHARFTFKHPTMRRVCGLEFQMPPQEACHPDPRSDCRR